ncbi:MAG: SPFH domain-containing protein [Phycisphaerales bacterium]
MKDNKFIIFLVGGLLLILLLGYSATYSVRFNEVAIVTTFGDAEDSSVQTKPGLHFKLPAPIQAVRTIDRRLQIVDSRLETQATSDGLQVVVQAFVFWRVDDSSPALIRQFNDSYPTMEAARDDIERRMRTAVSALSEYAFTDLIGPDNKLKAAEAAIRARLQGGSSGGSLAAMGIVIDQVGLSQVLLPVATTKAVIERMQAERIARAEEVRNRAGAEASSITANANLIATRIRQHADRLANEIRSRGDMLATAPLNVMDEEPELAMLLMWIDALKATTAGTSTFFLPPNMAPWHVLNVSDPASSSGVPMPAERLGPPSVGGGAEADAVNTPASTITARDENSASSGKAPEGQ